MIIRWKPEAVPEAWRGKVRWCYDGDTCEVTGHGTSRTVRIWGIDSPEIGQTGSCVARKALIKAAGKGEWLVTPVGLDKFGRVVARLTRGGGRDLGLEMVRAGMAWWYRQFAGGAVVLMKAEREAREAKRGIWASKRGRWAPWVWRRLRQR